MSYSQRRRPDPIDPASELEALLEQAAPQEGEQMFGWLGRLFGRGSSGGQPPAPSPAPQPTPVFRAGPTRSEIQTMIGDARHQLEAAQRERSAAEAERQRAQQAFEAIRAPRPGVRIDLAQDQRITNRVLQARARVQQLDQRIGALQAELLRLQGMLPAAREGEAELEALLEQGEGEAFALSPGRPGILHSFALNSAALTPQHIGQIQTMARRIVASWQTARPVREVAIIGHTDASGSPDYNQQLGLRRAEAVRHQLRQEIGRQRPDLAGQIQLTTGSLGESKPATRDPSPSGKAHNRRVEVRRAKAPIKPKRPPVCQRRVRALPPTPPIVNYTDFTVVIPQGCGQLLVELQAMWVGGGCEFLVSGYPITLERTSRPGARQTRRMPAGNQGIADACPGTGMVSGRATFTVPPGTYRLRVSTGGQGGGPPLPGPRLLFRGKMTIS